MYDIGNKSDRISILKEMTIWFWRDRERRKNKKQITRLCPTYDRRKMSEHRGRSGGGEASEKARMGI